MNPIGKSTITLDKMSLRIHGTDYLKQMFKPLVDRYSTGEIKDQDLDFWQWISWKKFKCAENKDTERDVHLEDLTKVENTLGVDTQFDEAKLLQKLEKVTGSPTVRTTLISFSDKIVAITHETNPKIKTYDGTSWATLKTMTSDSLKFQLKDASDVYLFFSSKIVRVKPNFSTETKDYSSYNLTWEAGRLYGNQAIICADIAGTKSIMKIKSSLLTQEETGTVNLGHEKTLIDYDKSFAINKWQTAYITISGPDGLTQEPKLISTNDEKHIFLEEDWTKDWGMFESWDNQDSYPLSYIHKVDQVFGIDGNHAAEFSVGETFQILGSTGNNGIYTITSITYTTRTELTVSQVIPDDTVNGNLLHPIGVAANATDIDKNWPVDFWKGAYCIVAGVKNKIASNISNKIVLSDPAWEVPPTAENPYYILSKIPLAGSTYTIEPRPEPYDTYAGEAKVMIPFGKGLYVFTTEGDSKTNMYYTEGKGIYFNKSFNKPFSITSAMVVKDSVLIGGSLKNADGSKEGIIMDTDENVLVRYPKKSATSDHTVFFMDEETGYAGLNEYLELDAGYYDLKAGAGGLLKITKDPGFIRHLARIDNDVEPKKSYDVVYFKGKEFVSYEDGVFTTEGEYLDKGYMILSKNWTALKAVDKVWNAYQITCREAIPAESSIEFFSMTGEDRAEDKKLIMTMVSGEKEKIQEDSIIAENLKPVLVLKSHDGTSTPIVHQKVKCKYVPASSMKKQWGISIVLEYQLRTKAGTMQGNAPEVVRDNLWSIKDTNKIVDFTDTNGQAFRVLVSDLKEDWVKITSGNKVESIITMELLEV